MNRTKRLLVGGVIAAGLALGVATPAHADDYEIEQAAACITLDSYPSLGGVAGVIKAMSDEGLTPTEIGRTLAYATHDKCPEHRSLVNRFMKVVAS